MTTTRQRRENSKHVLELLTIRDRMDTREIASRLRATSNAARMVLSSLEEQGHVWLVRPGSRARHHSRPAVWALRFHRSHQQTEFDDR